MEARAQNPFCSYKYRYIHIPWKIFLHGMGALFKVPILKDKRN